MPNDKDFKIKNGLQVGGAYIEKVGTITGNADVDLSTGNVFDYTPTANATFTFSNAGATEHSFVLSVTGDEVAQGYDLANASYDSVSFSVAGQDTTPKGFFFKPDGEKFYVVGGDGFDVNEYDLSIAWDITTASYVQKYDFDLKDFSPGGAFFKPDGTKLYMVGGTSDSVHEYSLSTAWNISTASFSQTFSVVAQDTSPSGLFFKADGTKMYISGFSGQDINEYNLSTAWNISTASYVQNFSISAQETRPTDLFFKPDGTLMYVIGDLGDDVNEYALSTAWDVSTASYVQNFSLAAQDGTPSGFSFKPDGTKMYVIGSVTDSIYQYSTSGTPAAATFTYPASVAWPNGVPPTAPAVGETDVLTFYTEDGGTTYNGFQAGDAMQ